MMRVQLAEHCLQPAENCGKGVYCLTFWALTCAVVLKLVGFLKKSSKNHQPDVTSYMRTHFETLTLHTFNQFRYILKGCKFGFNLFWHLKFCQETFWHGHFITQTFQHMHVLALLTYQHMYILSPWKFGHRDFSAWGSFGTKNFWHYGYFGTGYFGTGTF